MPQVYYVGLLAGAQRHGTAGSDPESAGTSNRHYYTPEDIEADLRRPVVQALLRLIRFRNNHPAFDGEFSASGSGAEITLSWVARDERAELAADLTAGAATVTLDYGHRDQERPAERAALSLARGNRSGV